MDHSGHQVLSQDPSIVWLQPELLGKRLDATYFQARFMKLDTQLGSARCEVVRLGSVLRNARRILYFHTQTFDQQDNHNSRVRFISGVDIDASSLAISWHQVKYVASTMKERYPNGLLRDDSILIKVKGPNQLASYVPKSRADCLVSGTFLVAHPRDIDPYFLVAHLTSPHSQAWRTRLRQNITVEFTPYEELREIPIFRASQEAQRAVGNKLRKAERLRELAEAEWAQATRLLSNGLQTDLKRSTFEAFSERSIDHNEYYCGALAPAWAWTSPSDEIAAQYYHPRRINAQLVASRSGRWDHLADVAQRSRKVKSLTTYIGLDRIDSCTGVVSEQSNVDPGSDGSGPAFRCGDVLFSRLRPYLNKVTIWTREEAMGSGELLVYRVKNDSDPFYVFFVLKSPIGLYQVIDVTAGSTHPRVDEEVVDAIRIPRLGQEKEAEIGERVRSAINMWYEAQALVPQAKADVEALVDGTLDTERLLADGAAIEEWLSAHPSPHDKGEL